MSSNGTSKGFEVPSIKWDPERLTTVRLLIQGFEVGSLIGKKGEQVRLLREESGARIHISDGSSPDRIVTITGSASAIHKAFELITKKIESFFEHQFNNMHKSYDHRLTMKLIVPAVHCGSIIGKGGCKIKEIREASGASVQVASDMLPNSTERVVTIVGSVNTILASFQLIFNILAESPARGNVLVYRPVPSGTHQSTKTDHVRGKHLQSAESKGFSASKGGGETNIPTINAWEVKPNLKNADDSWRTNSSNKVQTVEIVIPDEYTGYLIGKGGSKIAEIRSVSGAIIQVGSNDESRENAEGKKERPVTIAGNEDAVSAAKSLIELCINKQRAKDGLPPTEQYQLDRSSRNSSPPPPSQLANLSALTPLLQLLGQPGILDALSSLTALTGLSEVLSGLNSNSTTSNATSSSSHLSRNNDKFSSLRGDLNNRSYRSDSKVERRYHPY